jgi:hypothetical protein
MSDGGALNIVETNNGSFAQFQFSYEDLDWTGLSEHYSNSLA